MKINLPTWNKFIEITAWGLILVGLMVGIITIFMFGPFRPDLPVDIQKCSNLGEAFGGMVGALWSLAGVLLFFIALREQKKDVANNHKAISFNEKSQRLQRFENTFFQLISNLHNIVSAIELNNKVGKEVFEVLWLDFENRSYLKESNSLEELLVHYQNFEPILDEQIGYYFRNIYYLLQYIDQQPSDFISHEEKNFYVNIVGYQLSLSEMRLIAFKALSLRFLGLSELLRKNPNFFFGLTIPNNKKVETFVHQRLKEYDK